MKKPKIKSIVDSIRKPIAPPTQHHGDKSKYNRTVKHKEKIEE